MEAIRQREQDRRLRGESGGLLSSTFSKDTLAEVSAVADHVLASGDIWSALAGASSMSAAFQLPLAVVNKAIMDSAAGPLLRTVLSYGVASAVALLGWESGYQLWQQAIYLLDTPEEADRAKRIMPVFFASLTGSSKTLNGAETEIVNKVIGNLFKIVFVDDNLRWNWLANTWRLRLMTGEFLTMLVAMSSFTALGMAGIGALGGPVGGVGGFVFGGIFGLLGGIVYMGVDSLDSDLLPDITHDIRDSTSYQTRHGLLGLPIDVNIPLWPWARWGHIPIFRWNLKGLDQNYHDLDNAYLRYLKADQTIEAQGLSTDESLRSQIIDIRETLLSMQTTRQDLFQSRIDKLYQLIVRTKMLEHDILVLNIDRIPLIAKEVESEGQVPFVAFPKFRNWFGGNRWCQEYAKPTADGGMVLTITSDRRGHDPNHLCSSKDHTLRDFMNRYKRFRERIMLELNSLLYETDLQIRQTRSLQHKLHGKYLTDNGYDLAKHSDIEGARRTLIDSYLRYLAFGLGLATTEGLDFTGLRKPTGVPIQAFPNGIREALASLTPEEKVGLSQEALRRLGEMHMMGVHQRIVTDNIFWSLGSGEDLEPLENLGRGSAPAAKDVTD
jgi:hypothetical protein